ncbi:MAG: (2Fe-2S) ferredoxin domain-containing protein [Verrucomicrobiae bacterium]|nr:(2Fe-2S) ferredoxin domain-containing protein [Verrucomicrobiae bacterium]
MSDRQTLYLCVGSACHQLGGYRLLPLLAALRDRHGLNEQLDIKGAFCLETCQQGRSLKFGDCVFTGLSEANLEELFTHEILPQLRPV